MSLAIGVFAFDLDVAGRLDGRHILPSGTGACSAIWLASFRIPFTIENWTFILI